MASIGDRIVPKPSKIEVHFSRRGDTCDWFDALLPRVRNLRNFLSDTDVVAQIVPEGEHDAGRVWLCLNAAKLLDG